MDSGCDLSGADVGGGDRGPGPGPGPRPERRLLLDAALRFFLLDAAIRILCPHLPLIPLFIPAGFPAGRGRPIAPTAGGIGC